jgi:hypothetical protein
MQIEEWTDGHDDANSLFVNAPKKALNSTTYCISVFCAIMITYADNFYSLHSPIFTVSGDSV